MNNSQEVAKTIKKLAKQRNVTIGKMLSDCELSVNTLSSMQSGGYYPRAEAICKIADYLNCSVDYLLGRSDCEADDEVLDKANSIPDYLLQLYGNLYHAARALDVIQKTRFYKFKNLLSAEELNEYNVILTSSENSPDAYIKGLIKKYGISDDWLIGEDVPMFTESVLDSDYKRLNSAGRKKVTEYISDLTENYKYCDNTEMLSAKKPPIITAGIPSASNKSNAPNLDAPLSASAKIAAYGGKATRPEKTKKVKTTL